MEPAAAFGERLFLAGEARLGLSHARHLLLVGVPEGRLEAAVGALQSSTHERVEFLPSLPVLVDGPLPEPSPIHVHGATVFLLPVERYEVI